MFRKPDDVLSNIFGDLLSGDFDTGSTSSGNMGLALDARERLECRNSREKGGISSSV